MRLPQGTRGRFVHMGFKLAIEERGRVCQEEQRMRAACRKAEGCWVWLDHELDARGGAVGGRRVQDKVVFMRQRKENWEHSSQSC